MSFHKVTKRGREKDAKLNLFGKTKYLDRRSEWLRELNIVDSNKELFVCLVHFTPSDSYFPGRYIKKNLPKQRNP